MGAGSYVTTVHARLTSDQDCRGAPWLWQQCDDQSLGGLHKRRDAVLQGLLLCPSLLCRSSPQLANKHIWVSSSFISITKLGINTSMIFLYYLAKRKLLACM